VVLKLLQTPIEFDDFRSKEGVQHVISRPFTIVRAGLAALSTIIPAQQTSPRVIHITAERFSFTPSEIRLQTGEAIEFRIRSDDTAHGFRLIGTSLSGVVPKRGKGELRILFRPERTGRYTFECSRMCGAGHDFMRGVVLVRQ
jgi:cytochrome c oxidase subunit II